MIRVLLTYLLPLVLPTVVYLLWLRLSRPSAGAGRAAAGDDLRRAVPWLWLALAGLALVAATLAALALTGGGSPGETYVPPHVEDGRVVPGRSVD